MCSKSVLAFALFLLAAPAWSQDFGQFLRRLNDAQCSSTVEDPSLDFEETPADQTVDDGGELKLSCSVMAVPQATIKWLRNGKPLEKAPESNNWEKLENAGQSTLQLSTTKSQLVIPCVDAKSAGEYSCVADSGCMKIVATANVKVATGGKSKSCGLGKKKNNNMLAGGEAPQITMWTLDRMERFDAAVQLFCRATGVPKPTIRWYESVDDDEGYLTVKPSQDRILLPNGDLLVKEKNSGVGGLSFKCVAKNPLGQAAEEMMLIRVDLEEDDY